MPANTLSEETELIEKAVPLLAERLPQNWEVSRSTRQIVGPGPGAPQQVNAFIDIRPPNGAATLVVEARRSFTPRDAERLLPQVARVLRSIANQPVLVVAPWLSSRTQELLEREGVNFLDLTGNVLIRTDYPTIYIRTTGATRNPEPEPRPRARVRSPKAARLIRLLADVRPPYGVRGIADAVDLAPGYVSRLLEALDREALVERTRRGKVESVDVQGLLLRWAESHDVLKSNVGRRFISPSGVGPALERLRSAPPAGRVAITGSFAAVRLAPVAAPALLMAYADDPDAVASALDLLPADQGANVVLLRPFDRVVWDRTTSEGGLTYVAPSQATVDCLTGTGRMPSEGEALLTWMLDNESQWRASSLRDIATGGTGATAT